MADDRLHPWLDQETQFTFWIGERSPGKFGPIARSTGEDYHYYPETSGPELSAALARYVVYLGGQLAKCQARLEDASVSESTLEWLLKENDTSLGGDSR